ncbi:hypothetical protein ANTHELSMS3_04631 (plasmid) [Antarctobacter heliothermus]|uniref:Uncharacterized protein n=1 Tax=Antarctobacter heliothermus TaxID=74033 RepID=A0A222ECA7_9RHOB|nr:hypothetical protein [Antarctobacter heliothermus]ASP23730.1 hypothetical protein ANTHELSMS3_04631 [Antarctobacter heliothermus]
MVRFTLLLTLLFASPVRSAQLEFFGLQGYQQPAYSFPDPMRPCTHRISGKFQTGDADRMIPVLKSSFNRLEVKQNRDTPNWSNAVVCLNSPGGSLIEALKLADFFRSELVGTKLEMGANCESACSLLFMSGSYFGDGINGKWRIMHPAAQLGFHAPSLDIIPGRYTEEDINFAYAIALRTISITIRQLVQNKNFEDGVHLSPSLMASMLETPSDQMLFVETVDQAGRWGIQIGPINYEGVLLAEADFRQSCKNRVAWERDESALEIQNYGDFVYYETSEKPTWSGSTDGPSTSLQVIYDEQGYSGDGACTFTVNQSLENDPTARISAKASRLALDIFDPRRRIDSLPY